jgi:hypothetical protein
MGEASGSLRQSTANYERASSCSNEVPNDDHGTIRGASLFRTGTPQRHEQPSQSPDPDVVQSYDPFPDPFAPDEPEEVGDDDESDVEEIDTPTVSCAILKHVLAAYVAKVSNRATIAPVTASMKATRRKADTCTVCNDVCVNHQKKAYVVCARCGLRSSVSCVSWLPLHNVPDRERVITQHPPLNIAYMCERCEQMAALGFTFGEIMLFSRHVSEDMLRRYLNWGATSTALLSTITNVSQEMSQALTW